jgi:hypothetical protein
MAWASGGTRCCGHTLPPLLPTIGASSTSRPSNRSCTRGGISASQGRSQRAAARGAARSERGATVRQCSPARLPLRGCAGHRPLRDPHTAKRRRRRRWLREGRRGGHSVGRSARQRSGQLCWAPVPKPSESHLPQRNRASSAAAHHELIVGGRRRATAAAVAARRRLRRRHGGGDTVAAATKAASPPPRGGGVGRSGGGRASPTSSLHEQRT